KASRFATMPQKARRRRASGGGASDDAAAGTVAEGTRPSVSGEVDMRWIRSPRLRALLQRIGGDVAAIVQLNLPARDLLAARKRNAGVDQIDLRRVLGHDLGQFDQDGMPPVLVLRLQMQPLGHQLVI